MLIKQRTRKDLSLKSGYRVERNETLIRYPSNTNDDRKSNWFYTSRLCFIPGAIEMFRNGYNPPTFPTNVSRWSPRKNDRERRNCENQRRFPRNVEIISSRKSKESRRVAFSSRENDFIVTVTGVTRVYNTIQQFSILHNYIIIRKNNICIINFSVPIWRSISPTDINLFIQFPRQYTADFWVALYVSQNWGY